MKTTLIGLNAKYVHTNLAIRSLQQAACKHAVSICEMTINDHTDHIARKLLRQKADVYGFSCYIWNMSQIKALTEILKKSLPDSLILWGGPEVSYDPQELLAACPYVDVIIAGEGEETFPRFLDELGEDGLEGAAQLPGVCTRETEKKQPGCVEDLLDLPFAYTDKSLLACAGRIIYYESMRGCPFSCSYCLSQAHQKVRFLELKRVFSELDFFIERKVRQVKFVDRTFNVDLKRTKAIIEHVIQRGGETGFHFEIAGDLLDDSLLALIETAPKGLMQFEIGIQSTEDKTLAAITRRTDLTQIWKNVQKLISFGNCHVHVDLIAGLPYENLDTFKKSFNDTMTLRPHMLQLGFLKLLKGTRIRKEAERYGYVYADFPPYEVISNHFIAPEALIKLHELEDLLDRYYNSGDFYHTFTWLLNVRPKEKAFDFFEDLASWWLAKGYFDIGHSKEQLFEHLKVYGQEKLGSEDASLLEAYLKYDWLLTGKRSLPVFLENNGISKEEVFEILKNEEIITRVLPEFKNISAKQSVKQVFFQYIPAKVLYPKRENPSDDPVLCVFYNKSCRELL